MWHSLRTRLLLASIGVAVLAVLTLSCAVLYVTRDNMLKDLNQHLSGQTQQHASELAQWIASDSNQQRGECVLIIDAAAPSTAEVAIDAQAEHTLRVLLAELPPKQAAKLAATLTGAPRDALYQLAVNLRHAD